MRTAPERAPHKRRAINTLAAFDAGLDCFTSGKRLKPAAAGKHIRFFAPRIGIAGQNQA
jgi:hypothetical protein